MKNSFKHQGQGHTSVATPGTCVQAETISTGTDAYPEAVVAGLRFMIQEEKLAGDLYQAFYEQTGLRIFSKIAASEDQHMETLLAQAQQAGINVDDLLSLPEGEYLDAGLQSMYGDLLAAGSQSVTAALNVGKLVEQTDIADLSGTQVEVVGTPLATVYAHLLDASANHLAAFDNWLSI